RFAYARTARSIHAERCSAPARVSMTRGGLPESVTDALALSAGVATNFASSANFPGESVRLGILQNILPLVAAGQDQLSNEGCRAGRALLPRFIYWFLATFLPA